MSNSTHQKVALITGGGTGAGRAAALRFASKGIAVVVNYSRSAKEAEETASQARQAGVPSFACQANVADDQAVRKMVARCREELGGLDILVNNAGTTHFVDYANLDGITDEVWDDILNVNLKGTFYCSRAAMPLLKERKGAIVNITSVAGLMGQGSSIPYAASKGALNTMTMSFAKAFGPEVRVNAVAPGPILTRWLEGREGMVENYLQLTPMKRASLPEDVADAVEFLATGTSLITGQIVVVDGGRTMR